MTIWKYTFAFTDEFSLVMPGASRVLSVQTQDGVGCIWALVEPGASMVTRKFRMYGTGHAIDPDAVGPYIGTIQVAGGALVFHIFEDCR